MNTQERIIDTAKEVFAEKGISHTQMKEIAQIVGVNRRTLYRYFPTKEELLCHIFLDSMNQLKTYLNSLADKVEGRSGLDKFRHYLSMINIEEMRDFMFFAAQFDSLFSGTFSNEILKEEMIALYDPNSYHLYGLIIEGMEDRSIRDDLSSVEIFQYLTQSFYALYQRIIIQRSHSDNIFGSDVDYEKLFIALTVDSIRNQGCL